MIKEFKNIRERSERAKFLCLGHKTNNLRIGKKCGPKRQLGKILGPRARPLRPHFRRLCTVITLITVNTYNAYMTDTRRNICFFVCHVSFIVLSHFILLKGLLNALAELCHVILTATAIYMVRPFITDLFS